MFYKFMGDMFPRSEYKICVDRPAFLQFPRFRILDSGDPLPFLEVSDPPDKGVFHLHRFIFKGGIGGGFIGVSQNNEGAILSTKSPDPICYPARYFPLSNGGTTVTIAPLTPYVYPTLGAVSASSADGPPITARITAFNFG